MEGGKETETVTVIERQTERGGRGKERKGQRKESKKGTEERKANIGANTRKKEESWIRNQMTNVKAKMKLHNYVDL